MAMFVDGQGEFLSLVNGYMTGMDGNWREVDRRPAELRAKMNGKGKEKAIESNEGAEMQNGDEDRRLWSIVRFIFLFLSKTSN